MGFWEILLCVLFLVICFLLIIIVLLQKGKGGGLGAAFGGAGSSAFGTRTGDVFTWVTIVLTGLFLLLAVSTNLLLRPPPGLVTRPAFSPPPGPISDRQAVTLGCSTDGATIRYTTDGTDPDVNSAAYTKPLGVRPGDTIKARAFREKWTPSAVAVGEYPQAGATTTNAPLQPRELNAKTRTEMRKRAGRARRPRRRGKPQGAIGTPFARHVV
jgi:preprotein translocase subunit SecG